MSTFDAGFGEKQRELNSYVEFSVQLLGVAEIGCYVVLSSAMIWGLLKISVGLRLQPGQKQRSATKR